ncbi:MAG: glycosyltransferase family 9 protein [Bdellovibrionales bacterium]
MRLLVIQLARFGDIFQTWPALAALRRNFPSAEIDILVRERFQAATSGLARLGVDVKIWPTAHLLEPIWRDGDEVQSLQWLSAHIESLSSRKYDRICNLSFSPLSSYLTQALSTGEAAVTGYTRFEDGYLAIPDDSSAYFYAQVGVDRTSRYHLCDVFAAVAGVELGSSDFNWCPSSIEKSGPVIVHLGASEGIKSYPAELWREVIQGIDEAGYRVRLVGSSQEKVLAEQATHDLTSHRIENRVGESSLQELCEWIQSAPVLVGADSAPVQIASLMETPVVNLSCQAVRFWETGPRVKGSVVLYRDSIRDIPPDDVVGSCLALLSQKAPTLPHFAWREDRYIAVNVQDDDFDWRLLQALYTQADFPEVPTGVSTDGIHRAWTQVTLGLQNLEVWRCEGPSQEIVANLAQVDAGLKPLENDRLVGPILRWFQTERLRIGPSDPQIILTRSTELFEQLATILMVYRSSGGVKRTQRLIEGLREYDLRVLNEEFPSFIADFESEIAHSTNVASWTSVLKAINSAIQRRDLIEVADLIETDLRVRLPSSAC